MTPEDWPAVREIYGEGIATGDATFETELPDWNKWSASHRQDCRLVARSKSHILGWAALSLVSVRRVYVGIAEVSVYVAASARGRGIGKALLQGVIEESAHHSIWTLQAGIFPENIASVALHKSCGFRKVGVRRCIGKLGDRWRDTVLLERRSQIVGI